MTIPNPQQMLEAGVHFGHQSKHWHPKMQKYIYKKHSDIHVIDLYKTEEKLKNAADFIKNVASEGKKIIFIGTKPQSKEIVEIEAKKAGALYVTERWFGGTLTNFDEIKTNRDKIVDMKNKLEKGDYNNLTKKERLLISREIEKGELNYGGLIGLSELPGAVFVIDARREKTAVNECRKVGVPVVALVDTNTDPTDVDYVIPGNDDAIKSVALITRVLADAVVEGYKEFDENQKEEKTASNKAAQPERQSTKKEAPAKKITKDANSKDAVSYSDLSSRTKNALNKANVKTRADLMAYSDEELEALEGIGPSALEEIKKYLKK